MNRAPLAGPMVLGLLFVQACGSAQRSGSSAKEGRDGATSPENAALFTREKALPRSRTVEASDGSWSAQFPSESDVELTLGTGHIQAHFSLGTDAKTRCFFYRQPIDSGHAIRTVLNGMRQKVRFEKIAPYRITSAQGVPVVFLEGRYVLETQAGKEGGSLKLAVSPRPQAPALCFLDEPGFTGTFASAITELLGTIAVKDASRTPAFSEIWLLSTDGTPLGFEWNQGFTSNPKEPDLTFSLSSTFISAVPGELSVTDEAKVFERDARGIVKGKFFVTRDGEIAHDLELSRSGKSQYRVSGKLQDQDFKSTFKAPDLTDEMAFYRRLLEKSQGDSSFESNLFDPSIDPSAPSRVTYEVSRTQRTLTVRLGGATFLGKLTEEGLPGEFSASPNQSPRQRQIIHRTGRL